MPRYLPPHQEPEEVDVTWGKLRLRVKMWRLQLVVVLLALLAWAYFVVRMLFVSTP